MVLGCDSRRRSFVRRHDPSACGRRLRDWLAGEDVPFLLLVEHERPGQVSISYVMIRRGIDGKHTSSRISVIVLGPLSPPLETQLAERKSTTSYKSLAIAQNIKRGLSKSLSKSPWRRRRRQTISINLSRLGNPTVSIIIEIREKYASIIA